MRLLCFTVYNAAISNQLEGLALRWHAMTYQLGPVGAVSAAWRAELAKHVCLKIAPKAVHGKLARKRAAMAAAAPYATAQVQHLMALSSSTGQH